MLAEVFLLSLVVMVYFVHAVTHCPILYIPDFHFTTPRPEAPKGPEPSVVLGSKKKKKKNIFLLVFGWLLILILNPGGSFLSFYL